MRHETSFPRRVAAVASVRPYTPRKSESRRLPASPRAPRFRDRKVPEHALLMLVAGGTLSELALVNS
jgi:hypothetical protein